MNRALIPVLICIFLPYVAFTQTKEIKGKPVVEIFTDFHHITTGDSVNTGFGLSRAYFGYSFIYDSRFAATLILDAGNPAELAIGSKQRRYAHYREASISYTGAKLTVSMGITGTKIFSFQQKFWGKRYVANTYQSLYGYGFVADLGVVATYRINEIFEADMTIMNGEGYSSLQVDNDVRVSAGVTVTPSEKIAIRLYADSQKKNGILQNTLVGFAGYKTKIFYLGAEISFKSNLDLTDGHHAWGVSSTGGINITEKTELFARFDYGTSVVPEFEEIEWNFHHDGSLVIGGLQYTFNDAVKASLNYKTFIPVYYQEQITDGIYLNALFKF